MKYLILIFALTYSTYVFPTDTSSAKYMPLQVGNSWTYSYLRYIIYPLYYETGTLRRDNSRDTVIDGKKYFHFHWFNFNWVRYDSTNGNLVFRTTSGSCSNYSNEKIFDSLSSRQGDINYCQHQATFTRTCLDTSVRNIFNIQKQTKEFEHDGLTLEYIIFAADFGITYFCTGEPPPCTYFETLKGCVINGVVYGDTTMTEIKQEIMNVPGSYSLSQNFPNPFNPVTIINFQLSMFNYVSLKIFDIKGMEVTTLVNENLYPGTYEVEFDARNLPSGIYFYTLRAGDFAETKRMILLK